MRLHESITRKLEAGLALEHLEVLNESHGHNVPAGSETHFRVIAVSPEFEGMTRVARHRRINALLAEELAGGVHALAIEAVTPAQWAESGGPQLDAPPCRGGMKNDPRG
ncbi:MAG: BolA family transcriptional regulator [Deltaproteobacteria bacterium]|nr:MAG: BolA family transcriptional regulator [Deltaproteobacteria bacterium]